MQKLTTLGLIFAFAIGMTFAFAGGVYAANDAAESVGWMKIIDDGLPVDDVPVKADPKPANEAENSSVFDGDDFDFILL